MRPNPQDTADFATFTEEILNAKLHFLCSDISRHTNIFNHLCRSSVTPRAEPSSSLSC